MKRFIPSVILAGILFSPALAFAASNSEVAHFTDDTLTTLIALASVASVFFLLRGAYLYITSTGRPEVLSEAKKTIRNALIGLTIVIGASVLSSFLNTTLSQAGQSGVNTALNLTPIMPATDSGSLTKILLDAISGFLQNIVTSATKPVLDAIMNFLTNTPSLATNSVVFNFWLVIVGITDSLFATVIAILGFHVMSASTFGFEELSLKELFPRIGLAFVLANTSIFLIDWIVSLSQTMVHAVLSSTGGIEQAWVLNAFDPASIISGGTVLITLIFMVIFILLAVILLLFYISRLMLLAFGAVISPLIFLIWLMPRWSDFAESSIKAYLVTIFTLFVHVVIIQLASSFLTIPNQVGSNPFVAILVGIALFSVLLKSTSMIMQLVLATQTTGALRKVSGQILNVLSPATAAHVKAMVRR